MIGQTLGHYRILEKIGEGGMGVVYRAQDTKLGREVALKLLPEALARDPERLARFEREAQVLASLNHPHIAAIYGLEESDGVRYLVLELVPGETLAQRMAGGALVPEEALGLCRQIAEALEAAHEKGVVHRDLKPSNVKVTPEGKVKVLDFGLAKAFGVEAPATDLAHSPTASLGGTRPGIILGTAAYMSPEQARGKPLDKRTDIWSFGCVLYELQVGRPAFSGDTITDITAAILKQDPDWQALPASTPPKIQDLLRRCLQKDVQRRLRDIGDARIEMEEALEAASAGWPMPAAPVAVQAPRPQRWGRLIAAGLLGLIVGAVAAALAVWQWKPAGPQRLGMHFSAVTNFAGVEAQPTLSPDGRSVAFVSDRGGQSDIWVGLVSGGSLVRITNDANLESRPRWSPDGSKIAYARLNDSGDWDIWVVPALGGTPRRILLNAADPAWSPDGRTLAYAHAGALWLSDPSGGNARPLTQSEPGRLHRQPAFSRDGRQLAFVRVLAGPYTELAIADVATQKVRPLTDDGALALSPVWSPGNDFIYFASSRGGTVNIWKVSSRGGQPEQITAGQGDDADLDLSSDGKRIVFSSYRFNVNLAEIAVDSPAGSANLKWLTTDPVRGEFGPAYSRDGKRIAYFSNRKGAENESVWVMDSDGSNPTLVVEDGRRNVFPRWTADGKTLVYAASSREGYVEIRSVALSGSPPQKLFDVPTQDRSSDVAPDGRLIASTLDGRVLLVDPRTRQSRTLEGVRGSVFRWSPDGRSIAYSGEGGLWVYTFEGAPRQVFHGQAVWHAWAGKDEIFVVERKADLNAPLWRVRLDGQDPVRAPASVRLVYIYWNPAPTVQFDVHPDGRRIAAMALELNEADIGMIENIP